VIATYFVESKVLLELWFRAGKGQQTRYIPLHVLARQPMCEVLLAIHALTGCDVTSKFGTKSAAIKADPSMYRADFGKLEGNVTETLCNAQKCLVQVLNRGDRGIETLDNLRYKMYHQRKSTTILDLPPTSHNRKKLQFITLLTAIVHCSHIENSKNDKGYIT